MGEILYRAQKAFGSKEAGEWTAVTDSCVKMFKYDEDGGIDYGEPFLYKI